ncbi:MAG: metallopeptidase family protein [Deltaproteobacteria bacterium]|nr:metallopeptidase family protein [Deltaproteobacteria bacterium]
MDAEAFTELVERAFARLPRVFRDRLENVAVVVEPRPSRSLLRRMGIRPPDTLLGYYEGVPLPERGSSYGNVLPDRILIFQEPIEAEARMSGEPVRRIVRETLIHEVAHYFGFSDEEIEEQLHREDEGDA